MLRVQPLLWNNWVNTFPRKWIHATIEELCFLCGPCWGVIKRTKKIVWGSWVSRRQPARILTWEQINWIAELRHQNYWVQFSWKLKVRLWREDFMCAVLQSYLECVIQWDYYSSCVKIRCQETASGDCNRLRTLVGVTVNCKVWKSAIALYYELSI
jgi:hypothetical protein